MTVYYPCANDLIKRFHLSLKMLLTTKLDTANWVNNLPLIMLVLYNNPKEEVGCSPAEMVFGIPLSLPGQYFISQQTCPTSSIQELRQRMAKLKYIPSQQQSTNTYVLQQLHTC